MPITDRTNHTTIGSESQIIDQTIQTKLSDQFRPYYLISGMLFAFALLEWFRWYKQLPPVPYIISGLFLISLAIAYVKQREFSQELGFLNFGKKGEKTISEYIRDLTFQNNVRVYKNVRIGKHRCKFVLCTKFGLMLIDVIDLPLPDSGEAIVEYRNKKLTINGYPMDRDPIRDISELSKSLQKLLYLSSHKRFAAYNLIVFPNWYVKSDEDNPKFKIINPRQLPEVFNELDQKIVSQDQCLASYHLNKFIRGQSSK